MSYQHNRRLKAHLDPEIQISPAQYLTALLIADEIRANTSEFSISLRRLADQARISYATAQRSVTALVKLGVFDVVRAHTRYTAPIYSLGIVCPDNCPDLKSHNTAQELAWLEALRHTPKTSSVIAKSDISFGVFATNINKREEEDIAILEEIEEGSLELAILLDLLKTPKTPLEEEIFISANKHPRAMAKALIAMLPKDISTEKRARAYLVKVLSNSPEKLKLNVDLIEAQIASSHLIRNSQEGKSANRGSIDLPDYEPTLTKERFNAWLRSLIFEKKNSPYTKAEKEQRYSWAIKGSFNWLDYFRDLPLVTDRAINKNAGQCLFMVEQMFREQKDFLMVTWLEAGLVQLVEEEGKYLFKFLHQVEKWESNASIDLQSTITEEEIIAGLSVEDKSKFDFTKALEISWLEAHPTAKRYEFFGSQEYKQAKEQGDLYEISKLKFASDVLAQVNSRLDFLSEEFTRQHKSWATLGEWIKASYTLEDDLNELLKFIPSRPEGHKKHLRKFAETYLEALTESDFSKIRLALIYRLRNEGWDTWGIEETQLKGDKYTLAPDKYLAETLEAEKAQDSWMARAIQD